MPPTRRSKLLRSRSSGRRSLSLCRTFRVSNFYSFSIIPLLFRFREEWQNDAPPQAWLEKDRYWQVTEEGCNSGNLEGLAKLTEFWSAA